MLALNEVLLPRINKRQLRSLVIAMGISFTLLASQVTDVLAQGTNPPTPEPVKVGDVTFSFKQMKGGAIQVSAPAYLNPTIKGKQSPAPDLEGMTKAYDQTYGPIIGSIFDCAQAIANLTDNKGYLEPPEWSTTSKNVLKRKPIISTSNITIDPLAKAENGTQPCAPKGKQVISTILPAITTISPSKVSPPTMTRISPPSSTPIKSPTATPPPTETPPKTDTRENIKYVLGGALVLALLGLGSLAALIAHNSKNNEKKDEPNQVKLRRLPNETIVDDPRVLPLTGQGRIPFKVYMGDGKPELPVTFEPRVLVIDANDSNLLQRVLGALARAIKREDPSIVRAKATALMHHERGHGENTSEGVFILGVIRDQNTDEIIGAAVKDLNANATPEQRRKMSLGPQEPSEHDKRNARLAEEEIKKGKKSS